MHLKGGPGVGDVPETAARRWSRERTTSSRHARPRSGELPDSRRPMKGQRGTAEQDTGAGRGALLAQGAQRVLGDRRQFRVGLGQVGEFVDHHRHRAFGAQSEEGVHRFVPVGEVVGAGRADVGGEGRARAAQ
ncbi:hypothetical protein FM21_28435 [Streptomyces mutabilis]|uniref:Uncharacterized protein n=1 Tax=Streptomyces mutabilis TaxID=67332 RepID=A0A086MT94_9ACTN|nr:hypothetical protein FM21_28435 [Streptomyces mutabilis]